MHGLPLAVQQEGRVLQVPVKRAGTTTRAVTMVTSARQAVEAGVENLLQEVEKVVYRVGLGFFDFDLELLHHGTGLKHR